jgi:predicted ATPase
MPGEPPGSSDPLDPDGLVGRAAEAAAIRRMLDGAPLVTVTGLPGVGKTAVSLAAERAAAAGFADGSLLLRLDRLRDEALLPPCPKMQVLATSREPLRVPGETTVAVRPLRLADAVELFGRRAAQAGTQIAPQNPHIEHIYGKIGVSSRVQLASWLRSRPAE